MYKLWGVRVASSLIIHFHFSSSKTNYDELKEDDITVTYINKGWVEEDLSAIVQNINKSFTNSRKTFHSFLHGSSTGRTSHSGDREKRFQQNVAASFFFRHTFWISRHRWIMRTRRKVAGTLIVTEASQRYKFTSHF